MILGKALECALQTNRVYSVVFILSDFLEDIAVYKHYLQSLMNRHYVLLIDVAEPGFDREYPVPGVFDFHAPRYLLREGARHLEKGSREEPNPRPKVRAWNAKQRNNFDGLRQSASHYGRTVDSFFGKTMPHTAQLARDLFSKIK